MTDQQPHTPSTEHVRFIYSLDGADREYKAQGFDRWHAAEIAAAEQRGAIKALRDAAESVDLIDHMFANLRVNQPRAVRETSKYLHNRADQMEGDE